MMLYMKPGCPQQEPPWSNFWAVFGLRPWFARLVLAKTL